MVNSNTTVGIITSVITSIFWFVFIFGFLIIAIIKRRKQIKKRWSHPFSARLKIKDVQLCCHHCKHEYFYKREALIGTTLVTFFNFHYFNQSGAAYSCVKCGHIHWFSRPQESDVEMTQQRE